jgi:hypothetical protein
MVRVSSVVATGPPMAIQSWLLVAVHVPSLKAVTVTPALAPDLDGAHVVRDTVSVRLVSWTTVIVVDSLPHLTVPLWAKTLRATFWPLSGQP